MAERELNGVMAGRARAWAAIASIFTLQRLGGGTTRASQSVSPQPTFTSHPTASLAPPACFGSRLGSSPCEIFLSTAQSPKSHTLVPWPALLLACFGSSLSAPALPCRGPRSSWPAAATALPLPCLSILCHSQSLADLNSPLLIDHLPLPGPEPRTLNLMPSRAEVLGDPVGYARVVPPQLVGREIGGGRGGTRSGLMPARGQGGGGSGDDNSRRQGGRVGDDVGTTGSSRSSTASDLGSAIILDLARVIRDVTQGSGGPLAYP